MPDSADWITPTGAKQLVGRRMGIADDCEEVRTALEGWINDDRIMMQSAEVIRWESRYYRSYLAHWETEPPLDRSVQTEVSFRVSDVPGVRLDSSKFWSLAELTAWLGQSNQQARVVYAGIRLRSPDIERVLEHAGFTARPTSISTVRAERECEEWLRRQFAADRDGLRKKEHFLDAALVEFSGRLTKRGFNLRVWPEVAREFERDQPGAKRKS